MLEPVEDYLNTAIDISINEKVTLYDSLYIAQAKEKGCMILTNDKKQLQVAERVGVEVRYVK
ncbi:MAG: type II toxin-antitoxin system VapC family toxin [Candidatus Nitrosocaldus sp.]|nr:type II toxin-antitoxin system VapC family toxin [Candidatus Nitrosocaldus sp.]MDW8275056.1 type II toxin-antitoxin system VapC family toxin [Candidatus Nitrosocaldus sp.]